MMHLDRGYTDPLLVATYDAENSGRDDIDFYLGLATELGARSVIDLGCGTGVLAADLAAAGITVVGVDPAAAMLDVARRRPGGDRVRWVNGDADSFVSGSADLVVMSGHAAQVFLTDNEWAGVLTNAFRALTAGGYLAFETRNPVNRTWEQWNKEDSTGMFRLPNGDSFQSWVQVTQVTGTLVSFDGHVVFTGTGVHEISSSTLRFRSQDEVEQSLLTAGFIIVEVYGDWDRRPVESTAPELIFIAQKC